jgi:YjjG family noncanonical pyrimidine nucleotidase
MNTYQAVFFDLDHTLWDYETNSRDTLYELHTEFQLQEKYGISSMDFFNKFSEVNHHLWNQYNAREIDRDRIRTDRFRSILSSYYVENNSLSDDLSQAYISRCPTKTSLFPFAIECLQYLQKKYPLFILTNGFDDVQGIKLTSAALTGYFKNVITSETTGHRKPSLEIFHHAVTMAKVRPDQCLMVGDNLQADIAGAMNAGLHAAYFNPFSKRHSLQPHFEFSCFSQMRNIL